MSDVCPYCGLPADDDHVEVRHGITAEQQESNMRDMGENVTERKSGLLVVEDYRPTGYL